MEVVTFESKESDYLDDEYAEAEVDKDGNLICYCGAELSVEDEASGIYRCTNGGPLFKFDNGSIVLNRDGTYMIKKGSHDKEGKDGD